MAQNGNLHKAKAAKNDEFYTQLSDIEKELCHYTQHFKNKVVYCNCDNPSWSNFWRFFHEHFTEFGLRRLISTYYEKDGAPTYKTWYDGGNDKDITDWKREQLHGDGDFRSAECLAILDESDIVVTNPAFSLFREYVATLMEHKKKFLIIGNPNAVTYKEFFPLLKNNEVWIGAKPWSEEMYFGVPKEQEEYLVNNKKEGSAYVIKDGKILGRVATVWFTNLDLAKRHEKLILWKKYTPEEYKTYDNYTAINVDKVSDIPVDYIPCWFKCPSAHVCEYACTEGKSDTVALCENLCNGEIGVPITFMDKYDPDQFEIVDADYNLANPVILENGKTGTGRFYTSEDEVKKNEKKQSKRLYSRIVIRRAKAV